MGQWRRQKLLENGHCFKPCMVTISWIWGFQVFFSGRFFCHGMNCCYLIYQNIVLVVLVISVQKYQRCASTWERGFQSSGWYQIQISPVRLLELSRVAQGRTGDVFPQTIIPFNQMLGTTRDPKNGVCLRDFPLPCSGCLWQLFPKLLFTLQRYLLLDTLVITLFTNFSPTALNRVHLELTLHGKWFTHFACPLQLLLVSFRCILSWCVLSLLPMQCPYLSRKKDCFVGKA